MANAVQRLSVFFPAYNEADNIARTVNQAKKVLQKLDFQSYEIIIVNDGSSDATARIADKLAANDTHIRVIHHQQNRGYGSALISGFAAARYDWVVFTDSDGQFDFAEIEKFLPLAVDHDAVLGYRVKRQDHAMRRLNAGAWGSLMKLNFGFQVRDIDCAFKLVRNDSIKSIWPLEASGAFVSTELIVKLKQSGASIAEVGVTHYPRTAGQSTGANFDVIKKAFIEMRQLRHELKSKAVAKERADSA